MIEEDDDKLLNPDLSRSKTNLEARLEAKFEEEFKDEISPNKLEEIENTKLFSFNVKFRKEFIEPEFGEILVVSTKENPSTWDLKEIMLRTTFEGFEDRPHMLVIESFQRIEGHLPSVKDNFGFL